MCATPLSPLHRSDNLHTTASISMLPFLLYATNPCRPWVVHGHGYGTSIGKDYGCFMLQLRG